MSSFFGKLTGSLCLVLFPFLLGDAAWGKSYLLYFEAQGVGGFSSREDKGVTDSRSGDEVMQKPSLGFDYLQRFSTDTGDMGALALQARLAYSEKEENNLEWQLYNAYVRGKTPWADLWIGHNRPAQGLSSYFDSHGLLLSTLVMNGFGYDRDWGIGVSRDLEWGNAAFSLTTGTGMGIRLYGNYLAAARVSKGYLNQDNYNAGLSLSYGETLDTMGYQVMDGDPKKLALVGLDFTHLWNNLENRLEVMGGKNRGEDAYALFWRFGVNFLEEGRLKLEAQPTFTRVGSRNDFQFSAGFTYALSGGVTLRGMYLFDSPDGAKDDHRYILQIYFYKRL